MHTFAVYCLAFTYPVEACVCSSVPDHVSGVDGVYQDGPDSGICPEAAVDV